MLLLTRKYDLFTDMSPKTELNKMGPNGLITRLSSSLVWIRSRDRTARCGSEMDGVVDGYGIRVHQASPGSLDIIR